MVWFVGCGEKFIFMTLQGRSGFASAVAKSAPTRPTGGNFWSLGSSNSCSSTSQVCTAIGNKFGVVWFIGCGEKFVCVRFTCVLAQLQVQRPQGRQEAVFGMLA